jgi:hypothetical protein
MHSECKGVLIMLLGIQIGITVGLLIIVIDLFMKDKKENKDD